MKTEEIVRRVALLLGEDPMIMSSAVDSGTATLADRIRIETEPCLAELLLREPRGNLSGWRLLDGEGMAEMADGSVMLPLPPDFLLLFNVRLSGWCRAVTEVAAAGSPSARLQGSGVDGIGGTRRRPVAVEDVWKGMRCLRLYGSHDHPARVAEGWYMPRPVTDAGGNIEVAPGLEGELVRLITRRVGEV